MAQVRTFLLSLFFMLSLTAQAQDRRHNLADSLRLAFQQTPTFSGGLASRNAFVTGRPVRTNGIKAGLAFGKRIRTGIGYHWMRHGDTYAYTYDDGTEELRELRMNYFAPYIEYSFIARPNWEFTIPIVLGFGRSREFRADESPRSAFNRAGIVLYEPGLVAEYHFLRYFAAGAGVGLRLMVKNNQNIDQQFTAPIWEVRFRVKFDRIRDDVERLFDRL